jgi:hypothetical protein
MRQKERFVILLENEPICIGPFEHYDDAKLYRDADSERDGMRAMQLVAPLRDWRRIIASETKTRDRTTDRSRRRARMSKA